MAAFTRLARRIALAASVAAVAAIAVSAPVKTAAADGWHHGGYSRGGVYFSFGGPVYTPYYYRPRPVYYYPPAPVYYAPPPPVYYQPAPVYAAPVYGGPSVSFGLTVPIR